MTIHKPVLLKETIELLNLKKGMTVVDATLGGGGHGREILERVGDGGRLIAFDLDIHAIESFAEFSIFNFQFSNNYQIPIYKFQNIILANANFTDLEKVLEVLEIEKVDAVMADLGWSSDQLTGKGMSFQADEKLDMRLDESQELTAKKIVNEYAEEDLGKILREYGEEKFWRVITRRITEYRKSKGIETTQELAEIIKSAVPPKYRYAKIHPATKTFQAIRIEVNQELSNLKKFIPQAIEVLVSGGRLAIISFHSLEDRIVKHMFAEDARGSISTDPITGQKIVERAPVTKLITKKPVAPAEEEIGENPRARSAKLRVCERLRNTK
ncbi:MAG: 16S rRNA (cytosine(1402)-N(4))-methyltransferase RsmH [Candidatus Pacebacteria bacterium]|nr:16S rRNA (cytosine(1402)-N(4))-methyltransferase RsmH [Candidatus Paceibacterota bacterium]MDR3583119.1 16S rRNA (cytosine(1402)-N(4))-methyltransferase RsmH [Candidatus Paceibacterota bacterium]